MGKRATLRRSFPITSIGEDEDGKLYITNYNDGFILALEGQIQASAATPSVAPEQIEQA